MVFGLLHQRSTIKDAKKAGRLLVLIAHSDVITIGARKSCFAVKVPSLMIYRVPASLFAVKCCAAVSCL